MDFSIQLRDPNGKPEVTEESPQRWVLRTVRFSFFRTWPRNSTPRGPQACKRHSRCAPVRQCLPRPATRPFAASMKSFHEEGNASLASEKRAFANSLTKYQRVSARESRRDATGLSRYTPIAGQAPS